MAPLNNRVVKQLTAAQAATLKRNADRDLVNSRHRSVPTSAITVGSKRKVDEDMDNASRRSDPSSGVTTCSSNKRNQSIDVSADNISDDESEAESEFIRPISQASSSSQGQVNSRTSMTPRATVSTSRDLQIRPTFLDEEVEVLGSLSNFNNSDTFPDSVADVEIPDADFIGFLKTLLI